MNLKEKPMNKHPDMTDYPNLEDRLSVFLPTAILIWWMYTIAGTTGLLFLGALAFMLGPLSLVAYIHEKLRVG